MTVTVAQDTAMYRRILVDWFRQNGANWYELMIKLDRQPIRPPGPNRQVARLLAGAEVKRLAEGTLWFADDTMCDLVEGSHETMPVFAAVEQDLPSRSGFLLFQRPVLARVPDRRNLSMAVDQVLGMGLGSSDLDIVRSVQALAAEQDRPVPEVIESIAAVIGGGDLVKTGQARTWLRSVCGVELREAAEAMAGERLEIGAVSWSPWNGSFHGVWFSFYAWSSYRDFNVRIGVPDLVVDNEAIIALYPGSGDSARFVLPSSTDTTAGWARVVFATFRLAAQRGLCSQSTERTARAERRRGAREGLPERDITVVRLRSSSSSSADHARQGSGRSYGCRWAVRGHWRNQWFPSVKDHRPIWINQHIKGPDDKPLRGGDRVTII